MVVDTKNQDVLGLFRRADQAEIAVLKIRAGKLTEVEIECDLPAGGTLRLHRRCYDIWVAEWTARFENNASTGTDAG